MDKGEEAECLRMVREYSRRADDARRNSAANPEDVRAFVEAAALENLMFPKLTLNDGGVSLEEMSFCLGKLQVLFAVASFLGMDALALELNVGKTNVMKRIRSRRTSELSEKEKEELNVKLYGPHYHSINDLRRSHE